jgi:protein ImuA
VVETSHNPFMSQPGSDIINRLRQEILPLQGYRSSLGRSTVKIDLAGIKTAFPNSQFPLGAIHEFMVNGAETKAASAGFISAILGTLMSDKGVVLWISADRTIFPPALKFFNIEPHRIIFIDLRNQKEVAWVVEEALKLNGLAAVIGEINDLDFTTSRRLQLAVEKSQVTGFLLNNSKKKNNSNACLCRWQIRAAPSMPIDDLPGVGYPCWKVELVKVRNGRPGAWEIAWANGQFAMRNDKPVLIKELHKKTG